MEEINLEIYGIFGTYLIIFFPQPKQSTQHAVPFFGTILRHNNINKLCGIIAI